MKIIGPKFRSINGVKSGYTLIELLVVLGILAVGTIIMYPGMDNYKNKSEAMEMNYAVDEIIEFVNGCKSYARLENSTVAIKFIENRMLLISGTKIIKDFELPKSINSIVFSDNINSIEITGYGRIKKSKSINIYNCNGLNETITIKVGTSYVSIQK